jgi:hypothetical protein
MPHSLEEKKVLTRPIGAYGRSRGFTALAVEQYRLENGQLPESLDELTPAHIPSIPIDPFTAEPMRYRVGESGFVVNSVADNLFDDKGQGTRTG